MRVKSVCKNKDKKKSTQSARSARSAQSARSAVCMVCVLGWPSSERPFLLPLAYTIISTTSEMMSFTSDLSASVPNMKLFASTQEIDSPYFSETSWSETITYLHFFRTFLFLVVDPKFELFWISSIELSGLDSHDDGEQELEWSGMDEVTILSTSDSRSAILACINFSSSSRDSIRTFFAANSALR